MCACSMVGIGFVVGMEVAAGVCSGVGLRVLGGRWILYGIWIDVGVVVRDRVLFEEDVGTSA